jgi:catechol 2,3-dioxygenase-like lactoylglutathione lyase family enzyme
MIKGIFHINVNCSNFERSLEFYKMLGFRVEVDIPEGDKSESVKALGFGQGNFRAAIMQIGDDPRSTRLDLSNGKARATRRSPTRS